MNMTYPSDLTDAEWDCLQGYLPSRSLHGKLRRHSLRSVFDALFYLLRTGRPWRYLPSSFPPWQTGYYHWRQFCRTGLWTLVYRALRETERRRVGRDPDPSAAIMDAQSVKTVEESGRIRGYDAHKCVKGRKRHLLVDTLGLPLSVLLPKHTERTPGEHRPEQPTGCVAHLRSSPSKRQDSRLVTRTACRVTYSWGGASRGCEGRHS
jgi:putative transposase